MIEHESSMKGFLIFVLLEVIELLYAQKGTSFRLFTNEKETGSELAFEKTAGIVGTSGILGYWGRAGQLLVNFFPVSNKRHRSLCES